MRKCQSAMEYLISYGWAIIILIVIGAFIYLNLPSSDNYDISSMTEKSFLKSEIGIDEHRLDVDGSVWIRFVNRDFRDKTIEKITIGNATFDVNRKIKGGDAYVFSGNSSLLKGSFWDEYRYNISIEYRNPSSLEHKEYGLFYGHYNDRPPITEEDNYIGEVRIIDVNGSFQKAEFLKGSYNSPVIVCTYNLKTKTDADAVIRIKNASHHSFFIRAQNPEGGTAASSKAYCLIIEEGTYNLSSGLKLEAHKIVSSKTNENNDWSIYQHINYNQPYSNPIVFGQVMSFNDSRWSVFWDSSSNRKNPPSSSYLNIGKHVGEDTVTSRNSEYIGYIVAEAGSGTIGNLSYKVQLGSDSIRGAGNSPPYSYNLGGAYSAGIATQAAMDGGDGGWAVLYGNSPIGTSIHLAIDEDNIGDSERKHTTEQVAYFVFNSTGLI